MIEDLPAEVVARASRLVGVGAASGAVVVGLSTVRRTGDLALIFVDASLSANTQGELDRWTARGARLLRCADLAGLTGVMGRQDVSVLGVRRGALAQGIVALLPPSPTAA